MSHWNHNEGNTNFQRPLKVVGPVMVNAAISEEDASVACSSKNAVHELADGEYRDDVWFVRRAEIIYRIVDGTSHQIYNSGVQSSGSESSTVYGMASLCGQGEAVQGEAGKEGHTLLNAKIQVIGIAEVGTDSNKAKRFNIMIGGVHPARNNSPWTIDAGDHLYAYVPSREEFKTLNGNMATALRTPWERKGDVRLWFRPLRPELHKNQLKPIYNCLKDTSHDQPIMEPYRKHCEEMLDSIYGMAMVVVSTLLDVDDNLFVGYKDKKVETLKRMMEMMGHSQYKGERAGQDNKDSAQKVMDSLFVPFSMGKNYATKRIFDDPAKGFEEGKINKIQKESTDKFLQSSRFFIAQLNNLMVGQAMTTAKPGYDFSIQLRPRQG